MSAVAEEPVAEPSTSEEKAETTSAVPGESRQEEEEDSPERRALILKIMSGQDEVRRCVKTMENARKITRSCDAKYKEILEELPLLLDEREYAYTSVWTEPVEKEAQMDPWFYERIHSLDRELRQKTRQYDTLVDFMKRAIKEKKLPKDFEQPGAIVWRLEKLEADLIEVRRARDRIIVGNKAENLCISTVKDYREDSNLLHDREHSTLRETTGLAYSIKNKKSELKKLIAELCDKYSHVVISDVDEWRIVSKDELPKPEEPVPDEVSDVELVEESEEKLEDISDEVMVVE